MRYDFSVPSILPISFLLGHQAAIEGYHPPAGFSDRLRNLTGYPKSAFRAIARHETLDIRHKRELFEVLDMLPLERKKETMLAVGGLHTMQAGIDVLVEIHADVVSK